MGKCISALRTAGLFGQISGGLTPHGSRLATRLLLAGLFFAFTACAQPARAPAGAPASAGEQAVSGQPGPPRTVQLAVRYEAVSLHPKATAAQGVNATLRIFNAQLAYIDGDGNSHPYLAESLPRLNTDSWRVLLDGRMEVLYQLRKGLSWHDGMPLTADDFVFAHRLYTTPGVGLLTPTPQNMMEGVDARDSQTFVIRWSRLYPEAANLRPGDFDPLPRHILEGPLNRFEQDPVAQQEAFRNLPYWTIEYTGAGPFQLERWEPGSTLEGVAFGGHALGRPRIDRLIVRIISDENSALSSMLSESLDVATDLTLRYEHATVLLGNWETSKRGVVIFDRGSFNHTIIQHRPDYQKFPALLDVRVRRALAHTMDRQTLNDALFDGKGYTTESAIPSEPRYAAQLERAISRYPYDPRRAEQLLGEAGFAKDSGGFFASAQGERFKPDFWAIQSPLYERQQAIMHETWSRAGIDTNLRIMGAAQLRDFEAAVTVPGLSMRQSNASEPTLLSMFTSAQIGSPANRWLGWNRGGWSNPEYDQLFEAYNTTLERAERDRQMIEMMRIATDQMPVLPGYFLLDVLAHLTRVRGPAGGSIERLYLWNIHEWDVVG